MATTHNPRAPNIVRTGRNNEMDHRHRRICVVRCNVWYGTYVLYAVWYVPYYTIPCHIIQYTIQYHTYPVLYNNLLLLHMDDARGEPPFLTLYGMVTDFMSLTELFVYGTSIVLCIHTYVVLVHNLHLLVLCRRPKYRTHIAFL